MPNSAAIKPVIDIDGNGYDTVIISTQFWTKQNLNTTRYRNGDPIPKVTDATTWATLTTGAWCWYNNDSATYAATYGRLYNWYTVNDPRGMTPIGWHVPSDTEWAIMENNLGGAAVVGGAMKETGTKHWTTPNYGATNSSGFTGLPGAYRNASDGSFYYIGDYGYWWSSTEISATGALNRGLFYNNGNIINIRNGYHKRFGFSVRCVRD